MTIPYNDDDEGDDDDDDDDEGDDDDGDNCEFQNVQIASFPLLFEPKSLWALRALTSSWRPFGPLDFIRPA